MIARVFHFVRLPLLLIFLFAAFRFWMGAKGVPYAPRGNAAFSIVVITWVSCIYFGAMSRKVAGLNWGGTVLIGVTLGLWAQILIFVATYLSYAMGIETSYFRHWDALNVPEGTVVPMAQALKVRAFAFLIFPIISLVVASIGRLLGFLAPEAPRGLKAGD
jgi:hypothetical protein